MKIAVIGGGISGLSAAYFLSTEHKITLFEASDWLGGHAHTVPVVLGERSYSIDTGFMGYTELTYPNLTRLFRDLGVQTQFMPLHFSVSIDNGLFEFSSKIPKGILAQPLNFFKPKFWVFVYSILRFNRLVERAYRKRLYTDLTLGELLDRFAFPTVFRTHYLYPMAGSIWSTPQTEIEKFPAWTLIEFFMNHRLASLHPLVDWRSVTNGSREYVERIRQILLQRKCVVRTNSKVNEIQRREATTIVRTQDGSDEFDVLVMATHAHNALTLLSDTGAEVRDVLSQFQYQKNEVVLHQDVSFMPLRKGTWATWNFRGTSTCCLASEVSLTYDMRAMHQIADDIHLFITLNPDKPIAEDTVIERFHYEHPLYTKKSVAAQKKLASIQGLQSTYFCGSYFGYGFHEDGISSALKVAELLGVKNPWKK